MANPVRSIFSALHTLIRKILGHSKNKPPIKNKIDTPYSNPPVLHEKKHRDRRWWVKKWWANKKKKDCDDKSDLEKAAEKKRKRKRKGRDHDDKD